MQISKWCTGVIIAFSLLFSACSGGNNADIIHNGTAYASVISPYTGKTWLDRNLGAMRVCITVDDMACYGDYYQWGRNYDGHQEKSSETNATLALDINSAGVDYITTSVSPDDWTDALVDDFGISRNFNWSKIDGDSVCPIEYRVPTVTELKEETLDNNMSDSFANNTDAFNNFLKLPSASERNNTIGEVSYLSPELYLWLNDVDDNQSYYMSATSTDAGVYSSHRSRGFSVRCIRDF